ncbi:Succinate dehydrogenase assembly factor 2 mitochondrial [Knufia obscura]|uniref:Succinate dehydrogenase assembly factor 2, mitochondrial n=2 Tax=Knufia TaxID=430999 RepID=A0AAN8EIQ8_9EURO|nr:Succinate dehydrogenase assembly factor 2 mitochondrial [Knufia obscura]KAK5956804.1 Succinate dehydrogenase assembly factor 2 mitochondrial [Knufia fluminis]
MNSTRFLSRALARSNAVAFSKRPLSTSSRALFKQETDAVSPQQKSGRRQHSNAEEFRESQKERPLNPVLTNTTSTIHNEKETPSVGADQPPPEFLSKVDPNYIPKDRHPENTERMTGGTQPGDPDKVGQASSSGDYGVGEMEGAQFKIEPLRHQSRKRGTLESDLLLSTFASENLGNMSKEQLHQYDLFLDENDWDIYYWVTQTEAGGSPTSLEYAEGSENNTPPSNTTQYNSPANPAKEKETSAWQQGAPKSGEWAQTVGTFKPAYRPVPQRWKGSEIIDLLRRHVRERSAGGVLNDVKGVEATGQGMGRMPDIGKPYN